ncbi:MAG: response regulator [Gemmatimonadales bacterium]|nr:MAG: response regulator [Gemmatimonadales bacterium]
MAFNVLVVDDSAVMRTMIIRTLRMTGVRLWQIHEASHGREALEILDDHWVDLALVDINMPVMNGEEFIDRVREDPITRDLSIIVVSTESSETRINKILGRGASFIHKPFRPESLREAILNVTGMSDNAAAAVGITEGGSLDF